MSAQNDLVLYASFLQNRQQEKSNKNFRLVQELLTGNGDPTALTKNLELSLTELKDKQLASLRQLWVETSYPALTIADFIRYHVMYLDELCELENKRLLANSNFLMDEKHRAGHNHHDVTAESLGLNNSRRPPTKLPPTHVTKETGANFGIDPSDGSTRSLPLLYPTPIISLKEVNDVLIYLPATTLVDFQPSLKNIILRGRLLGFGERHYDACLKIFVNRFFPQYAGVFLNGITASQTFENMLTVIRSHDIVTVLKDTLRHFSRESSQSFTEFGTILKELATRVVSETHLQMTLNESKEFAEDKLLTFVTSFTSDQVRKLFETERSTALRSNTEFYTFEGAMLTIYKIEIFVKPPPIKYTVPPELYNALTNDTSLTSSVMLQAMSILNIKSQETQQTAPPPFDGNNPQFNATGFQSYDKNRIDHRNQQSSSYPAQNKPNYQPYRNPADHRSNPRYSSPSPRNRTPSKDRNWKPQDGQSRDRRSRSRDGDQGGRQNRSADRQPHGGRPRDKSGYNGRPRSSSNSRGDQYEKAPARPATPDRQPFRGSRRPTSGPRNDHRARSGSLNNYRERGASRDKPHTPQPNGRDGSRARQGQAFQRRDSRDRTRSNSQGRSSNFIERGRSYDRKGASAYPSRSPSRDAPRFCPYCGGPNCMMAQCSVFEKYELSHWPCEHCPTKLLHRASAHKKLT